MQISVTNRIVLSLVPSGDATTRIPGLPDVPVVNTEDAIRGADIVILAIPATNHEAFASSCRHLLAGKIVVGVSNPPRSWTAGKPAAGKEVATIKADVERSDSSTGLADDCKGAFSALCGREAAIAEGCAAVQLRNLLQVRCCLRHGLLLPLVACLMQSCR
jgi:hypothetical protein